MSDFVPIATVIRSMQMAVPGLGIVLPEVTECYVVYSFARRAEPEPEADAAENAGEPARAAEPAMIPAVTSLPTGACGPPELERDPEGDAGPTPVDPPARQPPLPTNRVPSPLTGTANGKNGTGLDAVGQTEDKGEDPNEPEEAPEPPVSKPLVVSLRGRLRRLGYSDDEMMLLVVDRYRKTGIDKLSASQGAALDEDLRLYRIARK